MKIIAIEDARYEIPSEWNDLTRKQLILLIQLSEKKMSYMELQLKFFLHCIRGSVRENITTGLFNVKTPQGRHSLFADEFTSILYVFDFLFEEEESGKRVIYPRLLINHFKKVRTGYISIYGPNDMLDNITYNQFVWLQTWQSRLDDNPKAIDEFLNVIYSSRAGKQNMRAVRRMPQTVKTGILWFYLGTLRFLEAKFPHVFGGSSSGENMNVFDNQQRVIDSLADGDVTKKNQVRESLLYDALYSMEMAAIRMKEIEKQQKKASK
ncbi:MAG: hypothetical protein AAGU18_10745 [Proteiniphilum sp.]